MHSLSKNENISMRGKRIAPQQKKLLPLLPGSLLEALTNSQTPFYTVSALENHSKV